MLGGIVEAGLEAFLLFVGGDVQQDLDDGAAFVLDWLREDPRSGKLITGPGGSPENRFRYTDASGQKHDAYIAIGATFGRGSYGPDLPPGERVFEAVSAEIMDGALAAVDVSAFLVDLREVDTTPDQPFSVVLRAALEANLAGHGQSLVFLNRRGFASFLQCRACGEPWGQGAAARPIQGGIGAGTRRADEEAGRRRRRQCGVGSVLKMRGIATPRSNSGCA